jgi:hypothetical protein
MFQFVKKGEPIDAASPSLFTDLIVVLGRAKVKR